MPSILRITHSVVYLFAFSLLVACGEKVGGPCSFEQHAGIAEVIAVTEAGFQLRFKLLPESGVAPHAQTYIPLEQLNGWEFDASSQYPELAGAVVGARFYTQVSVMTEGTCTPVSFTIGAPAPVPHDKLSTPKN